MKSYNAKQITLLLFYTLSLLLAYIGFSSLLHSLTPAYGFASIDGQYVGRDFLPFYAAAKQAILGNIHSLYTKLGAYQATQAVVPDLAEEKISHWPWPYPPHYFLLIMPFAELPYYFSLAAWLLLSIVLPSTALWYFWRVRGVFFFATILNLSIFICLIMGQNALILSAIAGIGMASIKKSPILAGICFSILSVKPHFAILLPIALIFGGYWRVLLYTIFNTIFLLIISNMIFGWDIFLIAAQHFSMVSETSFSTDTWIFSIYSTYRALLGSGFSVTHAWALHFIVVGFALYGVQNIWRKNYSLASKWLAFGIAAMLCTPFSFAYDTPWIFLPVMAWIYERTNKAGGLSVSVCILLSLQIFAFAIFSINNSLAILIILAALALLLSLDKKENLV